MGHSRNDPSRLLLEPAGLVRARHESDLAVDDEAAFVVDGPQTCGHLVLLDDDRQLSRFVARSLFRRSGGALGVVFTGHSATFRRVLSSTARDGGFVVAVHSDYNHLGGKGLDDLAFVASAPNDIAFGGLRMSRLPRVLVTGFGADEIFDAARGAGVRALHKPVSIPALVAVVRTELVALDQDVDRALGATTADFVRSDATFGTRPDLQASQARLRRIVEGLAPRDPT